MRLHLIGASLVSGFLLGGSASAAVLQYGYDYTSGSVSSQGNVVNDDSGSGNHGRAITTPGGGDGGTYSADIPAASLRQNTTGIGSVNTSVASHVTNAVNVLNNAQVAAAGGLTFEAWIKPNTGPLPTTDRQILSESGAMALQTRGTGTPPPAGRIGVIWFMSGSNHTVHAAVDQGEWTHLAGVLRNAVLQDDGDIEADMEFYVNGVLAGERLDSVMTTGANWPINNTGATPLNRGIAVGNHPTVALNFQGLVYEPRVSLGALDPSEFTAIVPEPAGLAVLAVGCFAGLRRRCRRGH